ncbi:MAG: ATPase, T2SS/T4P/T4SS family [Planctomycetota bacterium]
MLSTILTAEGPTVLPTLAEAYVLVSWWKAIILALPFIGWGWFVSSIMDKHAARFVLPRETWNTVHLLVGLAGVVVAFGLPLVLPLAGLASFFTTFGVVVVLLAADLGVFIQLHNRDEKVPEDHRLTLDFSKFEEAKARRAAEKGRGEVSMTIRRADKSILEAPDKETPEYELRLAAEEMLGKVFAARGSQLDLEPIGGQGEETIYGAVTLVDGVRQTVEKMRLQNAIRVIDFWKLAAGLDVADRRRRQKADFRVDPGAGEREIRLTTQGTRGGPVLSMVFDADAAAVRPFESLGLSEQQQEVVQGWTLEGGGLVLLGTPPDNGLTTLMNATLALHDAYTNVVQTVEIDPQGVIEGVRQTIWDPMAEGPDHGTTVRSILRRDPDVLSVAEVVNQDSAREIVGGDLERSRVYVGVRADNALAAIRGFGKASGDAARLSKVLKGVVVGRLARRLCENCRVPYQPTPDLLKKLGLPADRVKRLFKKSGQVIPKGKNTPETCPVCDGTGYIGQVGIYEAFPIRDEMRPLIEDGNWDGLRAEFRKIRELPAFQGAAIRLVVQGVTSVEEVARITAPPKKPGGGAAPAKTKPRPQPA